MAWHPDAPRQRPIDDFDALYRGHVTDVYRYSLSLVRDPADAEDVTQTTFLNAYAAPTRSSAGKPRPWLIAIARNVCHERYRQARCADRSRSRCTRLPTTPDENHGVRAEADHLARCKASRAVSGWRSSSTGSTGAPAPRSRQKLEIGEATVSGLLTRGRNNLRLQLDQGMTCERAQWASPRLWANGLPRAERRAAIAHLRNCESCSVAGRVPALALGPARSAHPGFPLRRPAGRRPAPGRRRRPRRRDGGRRGGRDDRVRRRRPRPGTTGRRRRRPRPSLALPLWTRTSTHRLSASTWLGRTGRCAPGDDRGCRRHEDDSVAGDRRTAAPAAPRVERGRPRRPAQCPRQREQARRPRSPVSSGGSPVIRRRRGRSRRASDHDVVRARPSPTPNPTASTGADAPQPVSTPADTPVVNSGSTDATTARVNAFCNGGTPPGQAKSRHHACPARPRTTSRLRDR